MKLFRTVAILTLAIAPLAACSDDEEIFDFDDDEFEEVSGSFNVSGARFVSDADANVQSDLFAQGARGTLVIQPSGRFTSSFTDVQGNVILRQGTIRFADDDDDALEFSDSPFVNDNTTTAARFDFTRTNGFLSLNQTDARFDFDDDDFDDDADFEVEFNDSF